MTDDYQQCGSQHVVSGVKVTCHRIVRHDGPHSSSTYGTRWRDSGEVLPPPCSSDNTSRDLRDGALHPLAEARRSTRLAGSSAVTEQTRLAYADPPYLGQCGRYDHEHNDDGNLPHDGRCWDDPETHRLLLGYLRDSFDGWAYSLSSTSLHVLLPFAPGCRVASWNKPFAAFKRNVRIAYTWEPVLFVPGRDRSKDGAPVGRDHLAESIVMRAGFTGTKPDKFCRWVLDLLGYVEGDEVDDIFPGAGPMTRALAAGVLA